jgi:hypothetical protein
VIQNQAHLSAIATISVEPEILAIPPHIAHVCDRCQPLVLLDGQDSKYYRKRQFGTTPEFEVVVADSNCVICAIIAQVIAQENPIRPPNGRNPYKE